VHNKEKQQSSSSPAAMEGGRRPTGVAAGLESPDPEVVTRITRRRLTNSYKLKVLNQVESLREAGNGAIGAFLRTEGIYYSMVHKWAKQRDDGLLVASHGRSSTHDNGRDAIITENKQLRRKLEQTEKRLHKTELLVELQKKLSAFMEMDAQSAAEKSAVR
jgi:transposase